MSIISIIGSGTMATAIAGRVAKAGHTVEVVGRDPAKARALADQLGAGATTGTYGAAPAGDIVILAVPYSGAAAAVADFGKALDGKVIVDIANPVAPDLSGLVTPHGSSGAQETAKGLPAGACCEGVQHDLWSRACEGWTPRRVHRSRRCGGESARLDVPRKSRAASARRGRLAHGPDAGGARFDDDWPRQKRRWHLGLRHERRYRLNHRHQPSPADPQHHWKQVIRWLSSPDESGVLSGAMWFAWSMRLGNT